MQKKRLGIVLLISVVVIGAIGTGMLLMLKKAGTIRNDAEIKIGNAIITAEVATTDVERSRGLGGHGELSAHEGMLFAFQEAELTSFWMKDMKFPLDIVWIKENKVIGFAENVDPQIGAKDDELKLYNPPDFVNNVLELHAGAVRTLDIKKGDIVTISLK